MRVRLGPSPTGMFHVGGARTALYNYILAKQHHGEFILRIEDTDQTRYKEEAVTDLITALDWLGLEWDEGPSFEELRQLNVPYDVAMRLGKDSSVPYVQSNRLEYYHRAIRELIDRGKAYYHIVDNKTEQAIQILQNKLKVTASEKELRKIKEEIERVELADLNRWRTMPRQMAERIKRESGRPFVVRARLPRGGTINPFDCLRNRALEFRCNKLKDTVLLKSDGMPTYHLAHVVDDHEMGITTVLRGEEWISSFPIHWWLYDSFRWQAPSYYHLPLLLNPNGKGKISKRFAGADLKVFVNQYREEGYLKEAMINFMAFLGWNPGTEQELYSMDELVQDFNISNVNLTGAAWNTQKLRWFNQEYIKQLSPEEFVKRMKEFI